MVILRAVAEAVLQLLMESDVEGMIGARRYERSGERAARLGLAGAMITEYPAEDRRYDQPEYERFWAAAARLDAGRGHFDRVPLRGR